MKTKTISDDLIDLKGVCDYFGFSESTVRRKIRETREGRGNFILPLFGSKCRIIFRRSDVENWRGEDVEVVTFTPTMPPSNPQVERNMTKIHKELAALGVQLPHQASSESNQ
jgi:predicted DNA-binding transcriptional regulator AlpA